MDGTYQRLRKGENFLPNSERNRRLLKINNDWFYLTREDSAPIGPYPDKHIACKAAIDYVAFAQSATPEMLGKLRTHLIHD